MPITSHYNNIHLSQAVGLKFRDAVSKQLLKGSNVSDAVAAIRVEQNLTMYTSRTLKTWYYEITQKEGALVKWDRKSMKWFKIEPTKQRKNSEIASDKVISVTPSVDKVVKATTKENSNELAYLDIKVESVEIRIQFNVD